MDIISYPDVKKIKYIFLNTVHIYEQKHKNRTRVIVLNFLGSLINNGTVGKILHMLYFLSDL